MLTNQLKMALRHYRRQPGTTALYIVGLTLGLACALVIFLIVSHETSYDRQHTNGDRVYRVETQNVLRPLSRLTRSITLSEGGKKEASGYGLY